MQGVAGCVDAQTPGHFSTQSIVVADNSVGGYLPTQIGRLSSTLLLLDANANYISGTIPTEIGLMSTLTAFWTFDNLLSGTIPTEIGNAGALFSVMVYGNHISGTLPTQIGGLTSLGSMVQPPAFIEAPKPGVLGQDGTYANELDGLMRAGSRYGFQIGQSFDTSRSSANTISGSIPSQLAFNSSISRWYADGLRLSGTIPAELNAVLVNERALTLANPERPEQEKLLLDVDLTDNRLDAVSPGDPIVLHCLSPGISCKGFPPHSCSAMAGDYRLSFTEAGACIRCPPPIATVGLIGLVLLLWLASLGILYRINQLTQRAQKAMKTIFATASIVIGQVQIVSVFTDLRAVEDSSAADVAGLAVAAFADPSILRIECVLPGLQGAGSAEQDDSVSPQTLSKIAVLALPLLSFGALSIGRIWFSCVRRNYPAADKCARLTLILFMLQLSFVTSKSVEMIRDVFLELSDGTGGMFAMAMICLEAVYLIALWCDARGLARLQSKAAKSNAGSAVSRRATRLEPLTEKYASHAPYWQFVVWGRTLALIVVDTVITPDVVAPPTHAYVQTIAAAVVVVISLALQIIYKPFCEEVLPGISQNKLEASLLANNVVQLVTAAIYHAATQGGDGSSTTGGLVVDIFLCALLVAPAVVMLVLLLRSRRLRRALTGRASRLSRASACSENAPTTTFNPKDDDELSPVEA